MQQKYSYVWYNKKQLESRISLILQKSKASLCQVDAKHSVTQSKILTFEHISRQSSANSQLAFAFFSVNW